MDIIDTDKLTLGQVKELKAVIGGCESTRSHSLPVGEKVFLRTVTMHYTGRIKAVTDTDIVLSDAAWIADSGRFSTAIAKGELEEVEPFPGECIVSRGALVDCCIWTAELPRDVT